MIYMKCKLMNNSHLCRYCFKEDSISVESDHLPANEEGEFSSDDRGDLFIEHDTRPCAVLNCRNLSLPASLPESFCTVCYHSFCKEHKNNHHEMKLRLKSNKVILEMSNNKNIGKNCSYPVCKSKLPVFGACSNCIGIHLFCPEHYSHLVHSIKLISTDINLLVFEDEKPLIDSSPVIEIRSDGKTVTFDEMDEDQLNEELSDQHSGLTGYGDGASTVSRASSLLNITKFYDKNRINRTKVNGESRALIAHRFAMSNIAAPARLIFLDELPYPDRIYFHVYGFMYFGGVYYNGKIYFSRCGLFSEQWLDRFYLMRVLYRIDNQGRRAFVICDTQATVFHQKFGIFFGKNIISLQINFFL